ncbi:MAG: DUF2325 domain-containing protein [Gracilibacteraceae bacterium]|jgi:hypothetical protein|nr:DUF2325 domain-containing protein [Gracilibacteraceae bacterium]
MSVVIIGGNDRMVCRYKEICEEHGCKAKVFTQMPGNLRGHIGCPDLMILFTHTVSHKMVSGAVQEAARRKIPIERVHSSSACALKGVLTDWRRRGNAAAK